LQAKTGHVEQPELEPFKIRINELDFQQEEAVALVGRPIGAATLTESGSFNEVETFHSEKLLGSSVMAAMFSDDLNSIRTEVVENLTENKNLRVDERSEVGQTSKEAEINTGGAAPLLKHSLLEEKYEGPRYHASSGHIKAEEAPIFSEIRTGSERLSEESSCRKGDKLAIATRHQPTAPTDTSISSHQAPEPETQYEDAECMLDSDTLQDYEETDRVTVGPRVLAAKRSLLPEITNASGQTCLKQTNHGETPLNATIEGEKEPLCSVLSSGRS
jgi:hypothetical protein